MKTKKVVEVGRAEKGSDERHSTVISFRVGKREREAMEMLAEEDGLSLGEWVRERCCEKAGREQGVLPFAEEEKKDAEECRREMEAWLNGFAISARSLAAGWVKAKMLPKLETRRKRTNVNALEQEESEGQ